MKKYWIVIVMTLVGAFTAPAMAQTWDDVHVRHLIFPGSGTDLTNLTTIMAGANTSPLSWTLPPDNGAAANYILTNNGSGILTWNSLTNSIAHDASLQIVTNQLGFNLANANIWTTIQTVQRNGIAATLTDGVLLQNSTAAITSARVQQSPSINFESHGWNTASGGSDRTLNGRMTYIPSTASTATGRFSWSTSTNGGAYTEQMSISDAGVLSIPATAGDLFYASSANTVNRLPISGANNGNVIIDNSGFPAWGSVDLSNPNAITNQLAPASGGTGVDGSAAANGSLLIGNGSGFTINTLTGTTNQVNIDNSTAGHITLSLPQSIATPSTPTFGSLTLNGDLHLGDNSNRRVVVDNPLTSGAAGYDLTVQAGIDGGASDLNGGNLNLASGAASGNGSSQINFQTVVSGQGTGITTRNPATIVSLDGSGNFTFAKGGTRTITIGAATAGNDGNQLSLKAGNGTSSGGSDQNGGNVLIGTGTKANSGTDGDVVLQTGGTTRMTVSHTGSVNIPGLTASLPVKTDGSSNLTTGTISLTSGSADISGTLAVGNGGIGIGTLASNGVLYGNGTSAVQALAVNSSATNKFLTQSSSAAPAWATIQASDLPGSISGFANPSASVGLTAVNGAATTAMRSDAAPAIDQTIAPTWTGTHSFQKNAIGLTSTDGIVLQNTTVATGGATRQFSPRLTLSGTAWNSSGSASQTDRFIIEEQPVAVAGPTTTNLVMASSIGGGAFTTNATLSSAGDLSVGGIVSAGSSGYFQIGANKVLSIPSLFNTIVGYGTGSGITTGLNNAFLGDAVAAFNSSGSENTFIGSGTGLQNISGSDNTYVGMASGRFSTSDSNTFVGAYTGLTNTTGKNNTIIGYSANVGGASLTNATAIGSNATVSASNKVQLGDVNVTLVNTSGAFNTSTGYQMSGAAASGNYLRGNGTNFVSSAIQVIDVPTLNQNTTGTATNATNVATTSVSTNASFFPLFVSSSSNGNQAADLSTGFTFNPSTNTLSTTAISGSTSVTAPTILGGSAVGSTLTLQSTSATGTTDAINMKVGTNGGTQALQVAHSGTVGIGTTQQLTIDGSGNLSTSGTITSTTASGITSGATSTAGKFIIQSGDGTASHAASLTSSASAARAIVLPNASGNLALAASSTGQIVESDITNLTTDLSGKAAAGANSDITSLTGITGAISTATTIAASTSITAPTHLGGSAVGSTLTLQSTSATGTTDAINMKVGTNGGTQALQVAHSGTVGIGTTQQLTIDGSGNLSTSGTITSTTASGITSGATSTAGKLIIQSGDGTASHAASLTSSATAARAIVLPNASGNLALAASSTGQIVESDITNLTTDLSAKAASGANSDITSLTGITGAISTATTITASTSITAPTHLGGSAVGSTLTLQSTSATGTTDAINMKVGTNGGTQALQVAHSGTVGIGTTQQLTIDGSGNLSTSGTITSTTASGITSGATSTAGKLIIQSGDGTASHAASLTSGATAARAIVLPNASGNLALAASSTGQIVESDITNLTTDLSGKAASGANSDITSLTGITGAISTATTIAASTSVTAPTILGGSAVGSTLTLQSTSATGTTDAINMKVGTNGGTQALQVAHSGTVGIGTTQQLTIDGSGNLTTTGTITASGTGAITAGDASHQGSVVLSDGSSNTVTLQASTIGTNRTYTFPDAGGAANVILSTFGSAQSIAGGLTSTGTLTASGSGGLALTNASPTISLTGGAGMTITDGTNTLFSIADNGTTGTASANLVNAATGFTVAGAATAGNVLVGDGTKFGSKSLATAQSTPANPTARSSTTGVMAGLAGSITPAASGTLLIIISGSMKTSTNATSTFAQISYGTGTAPANNAALTGTQVGGKVAGENNVAASTIMPFSCNAVVTGLTVGTAYWLDLAISTSGANTNTVTNVSISAIELP